MDSVLLFLIGMLASFVILSQQAAECPANSSMAECGNRCEPNCADPPGGKMCTMMCGPKPACACQPGYARNPSGQCVSEADCPPPAACNPPCPSEQVCVPQQVQCVRAPCPPIPECVPAPGPPSEADDASSDDSSSEE